MQIVDVAVLFGGVSNESEISVITGTMVCNVLKKGGKSVLPIYIAPDGKFLTGESLFDINTFKSEKREGLNQVAISNGTALVMNKRGKIKSRVEIVCALNCCHGGLGEGGGASGLFELNGIPLASAGLFESSAFMDKYLTKLVLKSLGVRTAKCAYIEHITGSTEVAKKIGYPLVVKPCKLGSSIGIKKVSSESELEDALETAFALDSSCILEEFLDMRREINCAAYFYDGKVITSECEEVFTEHDLLSYEDKYAGGAKSVCPAHIPQPTSKRIKDITQKVYKKVGMRGIVRFDYILSGGVVYLSEINTVPGSLSYYLLSKGFKDFYRVLNEVLLQAKVDFGERKKKLIIKTGIINKFSSNACKMK